MADEKKNLDSTEVEDFEVNELDDEELEDAAGGGNYNCVCIDHEME